MRVSAMALALVTLLLVANASWAENENTTFPLHVVMGLFPPCGDVGDPCVDGTLNLDTSTTDPFLNVFLLVRNFDSILALQTAFEWNGYTLISQSWDCQPGQVPGTHAPDPNTNGGPIDGSLSTVFPLPPISGPGTVVVGRMTFMTGPPGSCVLQVDSGFDRGTHVVGPGVNGGVTPVPPENGGSVCAGPGGTDACEPAAIPVEATTWGSIKGQYRR